MSDQGGAGSRPGGARGASGSPMNVFSSFKGVGSSGSEQYSTGVSSSNVPMAPLSDSSNELGGSVGIKVPAFAKKAGMSLFQEANSYGLPEISASGQVATPQNVAPEFGTPRPGSSQSRGLNVVPFSSLATGNTSQGLMAQGSTIQGSNTQGAASTQSSTTPNTPSANYSAPSTGQNYLVPQMTPRDAYAPKDAFASGSIGLDSQSGKKELLSLITSALEPVKEQIVQVSRKSETTRASIEEFEKRLSVRMESGQSSGELKEFISTKLDNESQETLSKVKQLVDGLDVSMRRQVQSVVETFERNAKLMLDNRTSELNDLRSKLESESDLLSKDKRTLATEREAFRSKVSIEMGKIQAAQRDLEAQASAERSRRESAFSDFQKQSEALLAEIEQFEKQRNELKLEILKLEQTKRSLADQVSVIDAEKAHVADMKSTLIRREEELLALYKTAEREAERQRKKVFLANSSVERATHEPGSPLSASDDSVISGVKSLNLSFRGRSSNTSFPARSTNVIDVAQLKQDAAQWRQYVTTQEKQLVEFLKQRARSNAPSRNQFQKAVAQSPALSERSRHA